MTVSRPDCPRLVVVTPVHDEADNLRAYAEEVTEVLLDHPGMDAEVLFVDDGSADASWRIICEICDEDDRFRGVRLSRNFGSHTALTAGFASVDDDADCVATLAADLQDPPTTVVEFVERWKQGTDIVWGTRRSRKDSSWRVATSRLFGWLLRRYAMPKGSQFTTGSFLLMDARVLAAVRQFGETHRITFALVAWTGFDQERVQYDRRERQAGVSGWNFGRMIRTMYDAFLGFSALPIRLMTTAAVVASAVAVMVTIYLVSVRVAGDPVPGWTSQMIVLSVFFGVQFWLMAIVGEYLFRIYAEAVDRPLFFISERAGHDAHERAGDDASRSSV